VFAHFSHHEVCSVDDLEAVFFDDRIRKHIFRDALELFLRFIATPSIQIQNKEFSLPDILHGPVAEPSEGVMNRLSLGIKYCALGHDPDVCFHELSISFPRIGSRGMLAAIALKRVFETHLHNAL
jgi:hypothetical protein